MDILRKTLETISESILGNVLKTNESRRKIRLDSLNKARKALSNYDRVLRESLDLPHELYSLLRASNASQLGAIEKEIKRYSR
ncbi:hypothetical protein J4463_03285 [Candidatus Pacearchaeota archaeon]|nr:hypothetical protein [Candidatus Pacearchaeota archaeon]